MSSFQDILRTLTKANQRKQRKDDFKQNQRFSIENHRKNERLKNVCRLRWSQDFWFDTDIVPANNEDSMAIDTEISRKPEFLQKAHDYLATLNAATISIDNIIEGVIPLAIRLHHEHFPIPHSVLDMLHNIARYGNLEHLELTFATGIMQQLIDGLPTESEPELSLTVTILYRMSLSGMKWWEQHIEQMGIPALLLWLSASNDYKNMRMIIRIIEKICISAPIPTEMFDNFLSFIKTFLTDDLRRPDITDNCLGVMLQVTDASAPFRNEHIERIVNNGVLERCIHLIRTSGEEIVEVSLRLAVNIATVHEFHGVIIESGLLRDLASMLSKSNDTMQSVVMSLVSKLVDGNDEQIQTVLDTSILSAAMAQFNSGFKVQKPLVQIVKGFVQRANRDQLQHFIEQTDAILALCVIFNSTDTTMVHDALAVFKKICQATQPIRRAIDKIIVGHGGLETIEMLQYHENADVSKLAIDIIEDHVATDMDDDKKWDKF